MTADIAMVGLGVMGAALARNFACGGRTVAVHDRDEEAVRRFMAQWSEEAAAAGGGFSAVTELGDLPGALQRPARIVLLVPAGRPVDAVLEAAFAVDGVDPGLQALLAARLLGGARLVARLHEDDGLAARAHEVRQLCRP